MAKETLNFIKIDGNRHIPLKLVKKRLISHKHLNLYYFENSIHSFSYFHHWALPFSLADAYLIKKLCKKSAKQNESAVYTTGF